MNRVAQSLIEGPHRLHCAGGAQIYEQALPQCTDLLLTLVQREVEGDVFFPRLRTSLRK